MNIVKYLSIVLCLAVSNGHAASIKANLESPFEGSFESGVGLIRGWVCDASRIEVQIDSGRRWTAGYGTRRDDTAQICGDANNGFGLTFNWNLLRTGDHTLKAFADGVQFAQARFKVTTLGVEYLTGVSGDFTVSIHETGSMDEHTSPVRVRWSEPHQNFVIVGVNNAVNVEADKSVSSTRARLESPFEGSFESGVGLIRGWVCDASRVDIQIDGGELWQTAYGTARDDTIRVCGNSNNGFGLTFNWGLLGDGLHNLRAYADGIEFANVSFQVTTFGKPYVTGASGGGELKDFPRSRYITTLSWSEPHQNLVIVGFRFEKPINPNCKDISGTWRIEETATVSCTIAGQTETDTFSGSGTAVIRQDGCNVSYREPTFNTIRSGTVDHTKVTLSGLFIVPLESGVHFDSNLWTGNGIVQGNSIPFTGTGFASGTIDGIPFSCTSISDSGTFTRAGGSLSSNAILDSAKSLSANKFPKGIITAVAK